MRRVLTILAISAMLAGPVRTQAADPFDFGDRPSTPDNKSWQSEGDSDAAAASKQSETTRRRPNSNIKNYSSQLFGENAEGEAQERVTQSTTSRFRPTNSLADDSNLPLPPQAKRHITKDDLYVQDTNDSGDTLERFNEFLEARQVSQAAYVADDEPSTDSSIQTVAGERDPGSLWDLNSLLKDRPSTDESENPFETNRETDRAASTTSRFSFIQDKEPTPNGTRSRLTDPISTSRELPESYDRKTEESSFSTSTPSEDVNPFEIADVPVREKPSAPPRESVSTGSVNKLGFGHRPVDKPTTSTPSLPLASATHSHLTSSASRHTHSDAAPAVTAVWKPLGPLNVGQECPCELVVTNEGKSIAERVSIEARLPESVRIAESNPVPVEQKAFLGWRLDNLQPQETRTIKVTIVPTQPGPVDASAHVRYTSSNVQSLTVAEPQLNIAVSGPTEISVGEPATQTVTVRNPGTGVTSNIKLEAIIPAGLEHVRGERLLMDIGSLNPGETRRLRLALAAVSGGPQIIQVRAEAEAGLVDNASAEINVIAPSLQASIDGPGLRYLGREAVYTITVMNDGAAATDNVQLMHRIPEGFEFVRSDRGAKYDRATRMLNWFVGRLSSDQPQQLNVTLVATKSGEFTQAVRATSEHGAYSDAQMLTRVEGTASLVVEVSDLDDPVEVGSETAYEITITNEGTASANQVALSCELPGGLAFLKANGPSQHRTEQGEVTFQAIPEVKAGQSLTYQVFVKGDVAGDKRFRCRLTSDALSQPLFTEELTKFYGE